MAEIDYSSPSCKEDKSPPVSGDEQPPSPSPVPSPTPASIPSTAAAPDTTQSKKAGRRPKFTPSDDLIIAREVSAAKAHVAGYGEIQKRSGQAAAQANLNKQLSRKVTAKNIQDRYKKIQDSFDRKDAADRLLSGVEGEIGEVDELLGLMAEARNDVEKEKRAQGGAQEEKGARKERIGMDLVAKSLFRKRVSSESTDAVEEEGGEGEKGSEKKKRRDSRHLRAYALDGELESFGNSMKEADMARIDLERQRLDYERERFEAEKQHREKERELRREERAAQNELELEKFKMMMGAFTQFKK